MPSRIGVRVHFKEQLLTRHGTMAKGWRQIQVVNLPLVKGVAEQLCRIGNGFTEKRQVDIFPAGLQDDERVGTVLTRD